MVRHARTLLIWLCCCALGTLPTPARASCDNILPVAQSSSEKPRPITAADLIEMREIGSPDSASFSAPSPFAVSPDGRSVAFIINQADLATNGYCRALVVSDIQAAHPPRVLDRGGALIQSIDVQRGYYLPSGATRTITPLWSPDGRHLAYLRRDNGVTQAWIAAADGSGARALSRSPVDVEALAWSSDGARLIFGTRAGHRAAEQAIDREGEGGWFYDERMAPEISTRPRMRATDALDMFTAALRTGRIEPADARDRARLDKAPLPGRPIDPVAIAADGRRAWVQRNAASPLAPALLMATTKAGGKTITCAADPCAGGVMSIWWDREELIFLRREGWNKEAMAFYRWLPGAAQPALIFRTGDVLHGCVRARDELICTREDSDTPRRVVAVAIASGAARELFDPNPQFAGIRLGSVKRLKWRNHLGLEAWGDLVLPRAYRPGTRLPMVVVQYHSDGFLRGGTGDEYPIFLLAERGFAVLSTERPPSSAAASPELKTWEEIIAANQKGWRERRSLLSSVLAGIEMAVAQGYADPARVGITGLSDGSTTVAFGLINSKAFAAAAISTCCMEPNTTMTTGGVGWADWLRRLGYPPATGENQVFWRDMSLARNAATIDTPLLMQLSDDEFRLGLEAFGALREQGKPVEMYVFPGEAHIKWRPIHRRAVYERNIDWFSFWLQDSEDPAAAKSARYARWRGLKARRTKAQGGSGWAERAQAR
jgi:dipeptidyl aminopeptidase/acylaminoacyl peptidase